MGAVGWRDLDSSAAVRLEAVSPGPPRGLERGGEDIAGLQSTPEQRLHGLPCRITSQDSESLMEDCRLSSNSEGRRFVAISGVVQFRQIRNLHCSFRSSLTSHQYPGRMPSIYLSCALTLTRCRLCRSSARYERRRRRSVVDGMQKGDGGPLPRRYRGARIIVTCNRFCCAWLQIESNRVAITLRGEDAIDAMATALAGPCLFHFLSSRSVPGCFLGPSPASFSLFK